MSFDKLYNKLEIFLDNIESEGYFSYKQQQKLIEMYPELELEEVRMCTEEKGIIFLSEEVHKRWIEIIGLEYNSRYFHVIKLHDIYIALYTVNTSPITRKLLRYITGDNIN